MKPEDLKRAALAIEPDILRSGLATATLLAAKYTELTGQGMSNAPGALEHCVKMGWLTSCTHEGITEFWRNSRPE